MSKHRIPEFSSIIEAESRLKDVVKVTPLELSSSFSEISGNKVFIKLENLQKTGSFKIRGAYNKIAQLSEKEKARGVICASAGNHAQGVAYAATRLNVKSKVFMPVFAPPLKVVATRSYGADIRLEGMCFDDAFAAAMKECESSGATFIHPFDDPHIIAGQGTIGTELFAQNRETEYVFVPIGGGGLISGIAIALKNLNPKIKIIGVEAEGAQSMKVSMANGKASTLNSMNTIADGIAVKSSGELCFEVVKKYVDDIVVVNDDEIAQTAYLLLQRAKILAEPAGVVSIAAILHGKVPVQNKNMTAVISGGNINMSILEQILDKGVMEQGYRARIAVLIPDQAGMLKQVLEILDKLKASVHDIYHERSTTSVPVGKVQVIITFNLQDKEQLELICDELTNKNMAFNVLS